MVCAGMQLSRKQSRAWADRRALTSAGHDARRLRLSSSLVAFSPSAELGIISEIEEPPSCFELLQSLQKIAQQLKSGELIVYHYRSPRSALSILSQGFRMSACGQGDGGTGHAFMPCWQQQLWQNLHIIWLVMVIIPLSL